MPSPGETIPTIRSPGTAPPFGANLTGRSELMPRTGIADGLREGSGGDFSFNLTARLFFGWGNPRPRGGGALHPPAPPPRHAFVNRPAPQPRQRALQLVVGIFDL